MSEKSVVLFLQVIFDHSNTRAKTAAHSRVSSNASCIPARFSHLREFARIPNCSIASLKNLSRHSDILVLVDCENNQFVKK